jgi:hypothetical protein
MFYLQFVLPSLRRKTTITIPYQGEISEIKKPTKAPVSV